jgi:hypothetical protein
VVRPQREKLSIYDGIGSIRVQKNKIYSSLIEFNNRFSGPQQAIQKPFTPTLLQLSMHSTTHELQWGL